MRYDNFGDHKNVGDGVNEIRFYFGSGYRVYYGLKGNKLVIMLIGGSKSTQQKDIEQAKMYRGLYQEERL